MFYFPTRHLFSIKIDKYKMQKSMLVCTVGGGVRKSK